MKKVVVIGFAMAGFITWFFPGFNGMFATASDVSPGEGQIAGAVLVVGAAVVWFMPDKPPK